MRKIDISKLTKQELINYDSLCAAFKKYLMDVGGYFEDEADLVLQSDFQNPYSARYVMQEFVGKYIIDGKGYEVRRCYTEFRVVGVWDFIDLSPFEFYIFFDVETLAGSTIEDYENALQLYLL